MECAGHPLAAMGPAMVVGQVVVENAIGMMLVLGDDVIEQSRRRVPITRSPNVLAVGARGGVVRSRVPSPRGMAPVRPKSGTSKIKRSTMKTKQ